MGHLSSRAFSRARATALVVATLTSVLASGPVAAGAAVGDRLTADLDGRPIKLVEVGNWYCDDFSYPAIHCFSSPQALESRTAQVLATSAVDYATVYEYSSFAGSYMHMSQDYTVLAWIGWNDKISAMKGRNTQKSHWYIDWYYGSSAYYLCCNAWLSSLGSWDNVFSSVHRN